MQSSVTLSIIKAPTKENPDEVPKHEHSLPTLHHLYFPSIPLHSYVYFFFPCAQVSGSWLRWAWTHQWQIRLAPERLGVPPRSPQTEGRIPQRLLVFLEIVEKRRPDLPHPGLRRLRTRQRELPHSQEVKDGLEVAPSMAPFCNG